MYSLILTDIDGTLIRDDLTISEKTKFAFTKAREKGIRIVLSSGRYIQGIGFYAEELGIEDPILSSTNGALIKDRDRYLRQVMITKEAYEIASAYLKGKAPSLIAFSESSYAIDAIDSFYTLQNKICRQRGIRMDLSSYDEVEKALGEKIYKLLLKHDSPEECIRIREELAKLLEGKAQVVASHPKNFEVLPLNVDKRDTVITIEKMLGIPREEMIAFGDWDNDVGMLSAAGMGIAMANGSEKAKAAAKLVTRSNNEDGIYYALHDLLGVI